ncbi:hypothetical protein GM182_06290 [bacterium 3DAC]|nr:hypothetical protein [Dictyoglomota bacterium]UZN23466.1 hypothetical protein GM182_06290 [bacterium 3DAC]
MAGKKGKGSIKTRFLMLAILIIIANSVLGIYVIKTQVENILLNERSKTLEGIAGIITVKLKEIYNNQILKMNTSDIYTLPLPQQEAFFEEIRNETEPYLKTINETFPSVGITISSKNGIPIIELKPATGSGNPDFTYTIVKDIEIDGMPVFKVVVWEDKSSIQRYTSEISSKLINAIGILLIMSIILTLALVSQMTRDIEKLVNDIEEIAQSPKHKIDTGLPKELATIAETVNDISERLWKNTELLKDIIEASPMALILLDKEGHIRYKHQMSEHVFGGLFPISEWLEVIMPEIKEYIRYKEYHILNRVRLGDRIVNIHVIPVREGTLLALEDITDISKMEEQMRQKERLAALGTLSAGIAHEVRNPLTAIKGFAQMIAKRPTSEKNAKYIKFIIDEVSKLENLVREILDFAKEKKPSKSYISLDNILQSIRAIISDIDIQLENNTPICADENLMSSVFLNIIKNARDAGATKVLIKANKKDRETEIKIINNGPPIPEDILPHIFEPFSTKKSKGTGLGLAIVHNIITSHGGTIKAYNDIDGVVFSITLPDDCQGDNS